MSGVLRTNCVPPAFRGFPFNRSSIYPSERPHECQIGGGEFVRTADRQAFEGHGIKPSASRPAAVPVPRTCFAVRRGMRGSRSALAPRPLGKQPSLENRVKQLEKDLEAARRACARQEALVRLTQRSVGLAALAKPKSAPAPTANGKGRKPRRPMVRALKAAQTLRAQASAAETGQPASASLQPTVPQGGAQEARP